jgi:hypothetical protein
MYIWDLDCIIFHLCGKMDDPGRSGNEGNVGGATAVQASPETRMQESKGSSKAQLLVESYPVGRFTSARETLSETAWWMSHRVVPGILLPVHMSLVPL